jgi:hypothetical protein
MGWLATSGSMQSLAEPQQCGGESLDCRATVADAVMSL